MDHPRPHRKRFIGLKGTVGDATKSKKAEKGRKEGKRRDGQSLGREEGAHNIKNQHTSSEHQHPLELVPVYSRCL